MPQRPGLLTTLVFCAAATAAAQEQPVRTRVDRPDTVKVHFSGDIELDYVNRSQEVTAWIRGESNPTGNGAAATSDAENTFEGYVAVRLDVEVGSTRFTMEFG